MKLLSPNLQAFHAVAKAGSLHGASRSIHITQTGLTRRIAGLETELDTTLFLRSRKGMTLTDEGQALLRYCEQALAIEGETLARMNGSDPSLIQRLVVQGPSSIMRSRIIPSLASIFRLHPPGGITAGTAPPKSYQNLTAEFRLSDFGTGIEQLKRGECDILILPRTAVVSEFDSRIIRPEKYVLVGPTAWSRRSLVEIIKTERIIDFDTTDEMTRSFLNHHDLLASAHKDRHFANNTDALASLIENGVGYSVLSLEFAEPLIAEKKITIIGARKYYENPMAVAWFPRRHMPPHFRDALKLIK